MGGQRARRFKPTIGLLSRERLKCVHGAVGLDREAVERRDFSPRQGQAARQERCEAVRAGETSEGKAQLVTDPHRFMQVLLRSGLAKRFRSEQSPG